MKPLFLLFTTLMLVTGCSDIAKSRYNTYEQAKSDGLFQRGWLPDILPQSTTKIEVNNNLDLNISEGKFNVAKSDLIYFTKQLKSTEIKGQYYFSNGSDKWNFMIHDDGSVTYSSKK
ncbi:MAG: hypothetical protein ACRDCT_04240 [Shewanella sp.]